MSNTREIEMLVALTNGKAGRVGSEIKAGTSWRDVFRTSEDLLTATVFGRLAYLRGAKVMVDLAKRRRLRSASL